MICKRCGQEGERARKDRDICKACRHIERKKYYAENAERLKNESRQYRSDNIEKCRERERRYSRTHLQQKRFYNVGYRARKREHLRVYHRNWTKLHIDSVRARSRQFIKEHPRKRQQVVQAYRTRKRNKPNHFTDNDWLNCLEYWHHQCAICGRPQGFWHKLAMDHWIPISDCNSPGTVINNILPLCHGQDGCNNSKGNRNPIEWLILRIGEKRANELLGKINEYFLKCLQTAALEDTALASKPIMLP